MAYAGFYVYATMSKTTLTIVLVILYLKCEHLINLPKHIIIGLLHKGRNIIEQKNKTNKKTNQYIVDEFNKKVILTRELNETCSTMAIYQVFQNPKRETYIICVNFKQPSLELLPNTAHTIRASIRQPNKTRIQLYFLPRAGIFYQNTESIPS